MPIPSVVSSQRLKSLTRISLHLRRAKLKTVLRFTFSFVLFFFLQLTESTIVNYDENQQNMHVYIAKDIPNVMKAKEAHKI